MNERRARQDLRINVLRADQVGVWHRLLELALELAKPDALLRSVELGSFDYVTADGRSGRLTAESMAALFELPVPLVASTIDTLLELKILEFDGPALRIVDAADWFVPASEHPSRRN